MMNQFLIRRTGAECIGFFFLVLAACGSVMIGGLTGGYGHMGMASSQGLVVMVMVVATGHLSMANLNPAATWLSLCPDTFPGEKYRNTLSGNLPRRCWEPQHLDSYSETFTSSAPICRPGQLCSL